MPAPTKLKLSPADREESARLGQVFKNRARSGAARLEREAALAAVVTDGGEELPPAAA